MIFMRDYWVFTLICFSVLLAADQIVFSGKYRHEMWQEITMESQVVSSSTMSLIGNNVN